MMTNRVTKSGDFLLKFGKVELQIKGAVRFLILLVNGRDNVNLRAMGVRRL